MKSKEVRNILKDTGSVKFVIAVGGSGVKIVSSFVMHCLSSRKNLGKVVIFIHDADRNNGDCDQLRKLVHIYNKAHLMGGNKLALTEIILEEENLADYVDSDKIGEIFSERDPRKVLLYASFDQQDLEMDLTKGQYGRADVGAYNNMVRPKILKNSNLFRMIHKYLGDGRSAAVCTAGSITGGTGASYTADNAMQIREDAVKSKLNTNLYIGTVLLGPCISNPEPTEEQLEKYGKEYVVDSTEAFIRAGSALASMNNISHLLSDDPDRNGNYYLDRLVYAGNNALDPGQKEWNTNQQEVHAYHFLHFMLGYSILDFFSTYNEEKEEGDFGVRTIRVSDNEKPISSIEWENIPQELKTEIITMMRFCYIFRSQIIPLFSLKLENMKDNAVTRKWFTEGKFRKEPCIEQVVLDQIIAKIDILSVVCEAYMKCFYEIQQTTQLGTGRKVIHLFNQNILSDHLRTDYHQFDYSEITKDGNCIPDALTDNIVNTLKTDLDGTKIMYSLAEDDELKDAIKKCFSINDADLASTVIVRLIVMAVFKLATVLD